MTFFLDLWHDLREKRLWPVAVGLLAAALAIPAIMLKPAEEVPQPTIVANADAAEQLPAVQVDDSAPSGSKLETFSQRNPFRPLSDLEEENTPVAGGSSGGSGASKASASGASAGSTAGAGSSKGSVPGSGGSGGSSDPAIDPDGPSVQWFRYTADLKFGRPGSLKTFKDVESLTLLPNDESPAIVFMGVSDDAKSAIFFIADPAFTATGEGECNDDKNCRFVELGISDGRNEHSFVSEDGTEQFDVKLLKLKRENISSSEAKGDATDAKAKPASTIEQANDTFLPRLLYRPSVARETE